MGKKTLTAGAGIAKSAKSVRAREVPSGWDVAGYHGSTSWIEFIFDAVVIENEIIKDIEEKIAAEIQVPS